MFAFWERSYSKVYHNITKEQIWQTWTDINNWHTWDSDIEFCKLEQPFEVGSHFTLKPKGAPAVQIKLIEIIKYQKFTDCTKFFGAKMYGTHEIEEIPQGVKLTTTMKVTGPLGFIWRKLVAENIAKTMPEQTDALVARAQSQEKL